MISGVSYFLCFFLLHNGLLSRKVSRAFFLTNYPPCLQLRPEIICVDVGLCLYNNNTVIETVVDGEATDRLSVDEGGALCTFCEMIVFWIQVQLKEKKAKEKIFHYVDEVITFSSSSLFFFCGITLKMYLYVKAVREAPQSSRKIIYQLRWNHSHAICFLHHRKQILSSVSRAGVGFNF